MRHVLRTQRVDLDSLYPQLREDLGVFMGYVRTEQQMADMLTKASFTAAAWKEFCELCCMGPPFPEKSLQGGKPSTCTSTSTSEAKAKSSPDGQAKSGKSGKQAKSSRDAQGKRQQQLKQQKQQPQLNPGNPGKPH